MIEQCEKTVEQIEGLFNTGIQKHKRLVEKSIKEDQEAVQDSLRGVKEHFEILAQRFEDVKILFEPVVDSTKWLANTRDGAFRGAP